TQGVYGNELQQPIVVKGTITDYSAMPLPGVTIIEKGTTNGVQTDFDGNYTIEVSSRDATLVFSYVGMVSVEKPVNGQSVIDVVLLEDLQTLDEVVVVGYGTQKRAKVVTAVDQISDEAFKGRATTSTTQALQGKSPSLIIQQRNSEPGAVLNINVRGISTLGNNSPLVVIDGIVGGDINSLNPSDIDNVSVLKDAGS